KTYKPLSPMHLMKKPAILVAIVLASVLFIFATSKKSSARKRSETASPANVVSADNSNSASALFSQLHLSAVGLSQNVFNSAMEGLQKLDSEGKIVKDDVITIVDFSQPSTSKRLYVLDLNSKQILFNTLVAHGRNSGGLWAKSFSNSASSLKSSPGFYVTEDTYFGHNGYSLRLDGLEKNINDNARNREIVMHGAPYVNESAINSLGFLGRSWGCPAVPESQHKAIINTIKGGTCLFIYSPDKNYQERSPILNS
ncbi:MAG TPA: murein L,D-transpeptidase catalytic domain family protein, partial [Chitinophagaceae bacterium]|nr:murein L,D-transpeptidase catalytic domain family protein [Chitinophagaceae bacterium]